MGFGLGVCQYFFGVGSVVIPGLILLECEQWITWLCLGEAGFDGIVAGRPSVSLLGPRLWWFWVVWHHGKRNPVGLSLLAALAGVPIIHLWAILDLGMGGLVMVGRPLWVSLLVWTGGGGLHVLCILTDEIRTGTIFLQDAFPFI